MEMTSRFINAAETKPHLLSLDVTSPQVVEFVKGAGVYLPDSIENIIVFALLKNVPGARFKPVSLTTPSIKKEVLRYLLTEH